MPKPSPLRCSACCTAHLPDAGFRFFLTISASIRSECPANPASTSMKFEGTDTYVATRDLTLAVNAAIALQR
ncbi:MAG: hypothetical protein WCC44_14045, partial [Azonexus sp.]